MKKPSAITNLLGHVLAPFKDAVRAWREPSTYIDRRTDAERKAIDDARFRAKLRGERIAP